MEKKLIFDIICLLLGAVGLFLTVVFFLASHAFDAANEKESKWVGRAPASLKATKHKKDVTLYGRTPLGTGISTMFIKNMTKGTYTYTVNGKNYKRRVTKYLTTPRQTSYLTSAFYIKKFPRISYLKEEIQPYLFHSLILLLPSVMLFWAGVKGIGAWLAL